MPVLSREEIKTNIINDIENNVTGKISPEDIRRNLIDIVDSSHLLSSGYSLLAANFGTPDTNNTRVGLEALDKLHLTGYINNNNSAFGFHSLYATYTGSENSAFGSYSLGCNVYGSGNVAGGYGALAGNIAGNNNVGIGNHTLRYNKNGDNNIAIGNAAGYYVDENSSYKFYLASHNIDESGMCVNPTGISGLLPLLHGDLLNNKLAVNSNSLNNVGTLQVNGNLTPVFSGYQDNLGSLSYGWNKLYVKEILSNDTIKLSSNIEPDSLGAINLGSEEKRFNWIYADNIFVSGNAHLNNFTYDNISNSQFTNKTIYLASSGLNLINNNPKPYLTDEGINGGGFIIQSSGTSYKRDYFFFYTAPNTSLEYLEQDNPYSRSSWTSNISITTDPGRHIRTDRVIGRQNLNLINRSGRGIFIGNHTIFGTQAERNRYYTWANGANITTFAGSGALFVDNTISEFSGVRLQDNLFSRYSGSGNLVGFKRQYIDDNANDRFVISSYNNSPSANASFTAMKNGLFGFNNLLNSENVYPATLLNIQGSGSPIVRLNGEQSSILQLSAGNNNASNSLEIDYNTNTKQSNISINRDSAKTQLITLGSGYVGINTALNLKEVSGVPIIRTGFGNLFIQEVSEPNRTQGIYFQDDSGNIHDLVGVSGDITKPEFVYWDNNRNTAVGKNALDSLTTGNGNTIVGYNAGFYITSGVSNILIGNGAASGTNQNNLFELGNGQNSVLMSGQIPTSGNTGYLSINHALNITNLSRTRNLEVSQVALDTVVTKSATSGVYDTSKLIFRFAGSSNIDPVSISSSGLDVNGRIKFQDGTVLNTASGLIFGAGSGIQIIYDSGSNKEIINLNLTGLPSTSGVSLNSYLAVENSGTAFRIPISELSQLVNYENPQVFFNSANNEYNTVLSNSTDINHDRNTNTIFIGKKSGNNIDGFTNSTIIGDKAGENARITNPALDIDTAVVFIGYNSGRNSINSDNSLFIGQSAGQDTIAADNSIFIGNSAGQSSKSSKSIGIGDNTLENVTGENNIEIVGNNSSINRLINGTTSNKVNVGGLVAGDSCIGRVSVGGGARIVPNAVMEVDSKFGDHTTRLQEWYNGSGQLVAYLDQNGNFVVKGSMIVNNSMFGSNSSPSTNIPSGLSCGNNNFTGNLTPSVTGGSSTPGGGTPDELINPPQGYLLPYTVIYEEI
jgi:hypothetical protein